MPVQVLPMVRMRSGAIVPPCAARRFIDLLGSSLDASQKLDGETDEDCLRRIEKIWAEN